MAKQHVNLMGKLPWYQKARYIDLMGKIPEEFATDSEGYKQFTYNPRTKAGREYFDATSSGLKELYAWEEQKSKSQKKARNKKKGG